MRRLILLLIALAAAGPALAQTVVTSPGPEATSITLYRDPARGGGDTINRNFLNGFALITETRTLTLPAGTSVVRFEGVSAGILAESAILAGLPADVREKNLDADLLSPASLYDRSLGRRVMIRRAYPDGTVRSEQAVIRSAGEGAAVLETATGFEALRCSGFNETLVYEGVPPGLSAKPTLSMEIQSAGARTVTVQLAYLAGGFDWQANYVVTMRRDEPARLFGWVTLASTDVISHADAQTQLVAGRTNRTSDYRRRIGDGGPLFLNCWPQGVSEGSEEEMFDRARRGAPPPPPEPAPPPPPAAAESIMVTGARMVKQEALGDLKLYRVPHPTTVAANAQKQVALIDRAGVSLDPVYVSELSGDRIAATRIELRGENRAAEGLGVPLPAGPVAIFEETGVRPVLIGEDAVDDIPVGEDVTLEIVAGPGVVPVLTRRGEGRSARMILTVTNANPWPVDYEAVLSRVGGVRIDRASARLVREDGETLWRVQVPANGQASLRYRMRPPE